MNNNEILPVLNTEELKLKANEYAMKGAIKCIEDFYSGYDSPYRKQIKEFLEGQQLHWGFNLPDIIATINDSLTKEIDLIANTAISKIFLPLVQKFLVREEKEILFSDLLKEFINCIDDDDLEYDDYSVSVKKHDRHDWLTVILEAPNHQYEFTLHEEISSRKEKHLKYQLLSLPYKDGLRSQTMKISLDGGASLEMPFTKDILSDNFTSYLARVIIANSQITMDTQDFHEDMFPEDHCHC